MAEYRIMTMGRLTKTIREWHPVGCKTEAQYKNSLYKKLVASFKKAPVKEYGLARMRADLAYDTNICIEVKCNFNNTGKYHRLLGQLVEYQESFMNVIIVLVGETDVGLYKQLKKRSKGAIVIKKDDD